MCVHPHARTQWSYTLSEWCANFWGAELAYTTQVKIACTLSWADRRPRNLIYPTRCISGQTLLSQPITSYHKHRISCILRWGTTHLTQTNRVVLSTLEQPRVGSWLFKPCSFAHRCIMLRNIRAALYRFVTVIISWVRSIDREDTTPI